MLTCSLCRTDYPEGVTLCERDGTVLAGAAPAPASAASPSPPASPLGSPLPRDPPLAHATTLPGSADGALASSLATAAAAQPSPVFDSMLGVTLAGRYRVVRRIGEGGMGAVYEAVHTIIGKRVAVKVLLEKFLTKTDFVARLLQEARLASAIGNEHIVDVTDFGTTDDGRAFVAMEFLDGESLAQLIMREAPLPIERSLRIVRQVASALGAAHAKGIVHRDIKPENVYLIRRDEDDFVKVVDFGISKAVKQGQGLGDEVADYRLTHTGLLLGTPLYMSPEQARGEENLDHRVDIWALGVMLYECLTGEVPFRANNYLGIISQVLTHTARPPSQLRPELGIPDAVESVVMRAMEKDRTRRYGQMAEVERDLERLLAGDQNVGSNAMLASAISTPPPLSGPSRGRVWIWSAAGAALVAGVIMALARPAASPPLAPVAPMIPTSSATSATPSPAGGTVDRAPERASPGGAPEPGSGASPTAPPPRTLAAPDNRVAHSRVKRISDVGPRKLDASKEPPPRRRNASGSVPGTEPAGSEAVLRGVLPSRSGEGYPEN